MKVMRNCWLQKQKLKNFKFRKNVSNKIYEKKKFKLQTISKIIGKNSHLQSILNVSKAIFEQYKLTELINNKIYRNL